MDLVGDTDPDVPTGVMERLLAWNGSDAVIHPGVVVRTWMLRGVTDADPLAAGGDIVTGMQSMGYGQDEIDEIVCILVSLKDQVVVN